MILTINGETKEVKSTTIDTLLDELGVKDKVMASAVNMEVVKKENWSTYELKESDKVEFLQFVGGG